MYSRSGRCKVSLLGSTEVGKKSFINQIIFDSVGNSLVVPMIQSYGPRCHEVSQIPLLNKEGTIDLVRYNRRSFERNYVLYRASLLIIVMFDVTNLQSFEDVPKWLNEVERYANEDVFKIILGHKCDVKKEERQVDTAEAKELAESLGIDYYETSINKFGPDDKYIYPIYTQSEDELNDQDCKSNVTLYQQFIEMTQYKLKEAIELNAQKEWDAIKLYYPITYLKTYPPSNAIALPRKQVEKYQTLATQEFESQFKLIVLKNKYLRNQIWGQISTIHQTMRLTTMKINTASLQWLSKYQYWSAIKLIFNRSPKQLLIDAKSLSCLLRLCPDYHLLLQMHELFYGSFQSSCVRIMDELCIGGCVEMYEFLYNQGPKFRCSKRGLRLACQFGHLNLVKFITKNLIKTSNSHNSEKVSKILIDTESTPLTDLAMMEKEYCKKICQNYHQDEVYKYLKQLNINGSLITKLSHLFKKK